MATVRAQVIEGMTGDPLGNATVMVVSKDGTPLNQGVFTDNMGKFTLTSDILNGNYLLVSYAGLDAVLIATNLLNDTDYKEIDLYPKDLPAVIVTPHKNNWWLWLILGGLLIYGASKVKRKRYA